MRTAEAKTLVTHEVGAAVRLPLRLLLRFSDAAYERRFVEHYVAFYFRYSQLSLLLGVILIAGDYLVDHMVHTDGPANRLRLTLAVPVLLVGLGYSLLPMARRHWQPVMASLIVTVALCLIGILVRIDVVQPVTVGAQPMVLSASIGIAMFPGDAQDVVGLTRCAEQAARVAVEAGGAQHRFFDEALDARAKNRTVLENELRHAIRAGELCLHYQPKVDARSGCIVGAEALVRWQHPERGLIQPGGFIAMAEESGLIAPLTDWVLHAACESLRRWSDEGLPTLPLSVNLPASSLADAGLPDQLAGLMRHYRLDSSCLMLELTETMVMRDVATAISVLEVLRTMGFGLSLDDFGTGYSSLSYLKRLPMSELKIDRAFIADVTRGGRDGALAVAIITLGSELGLQVVAEGVETKEQSEFLIGRGCALQQGYLFSRPVPQAVFEQMLKAGTVEAVAA
jgi:EAL domain-containing protein (putative c-di-GMP-specific phosphodiesterase class I)